MRNLLVASEYTDPSYFTGKVIKQLRTSNVLLIITKRVLECAPIFEDCVEKNIAVILHSTITTLGGSVLEPNSKLWKEELECLFSIRNKYPSLFKEIVLRVDPIIPEITEENVLKELIESAEKEGIEQLRLSVLDCYPFVRKRFQERGLPICSSFQYPESTIKNTLSEIRSFSRSMSINSCAEICVSGIGNVGCADKVRLRELDIELVRESSSSRKNCMCTARKEDLLRNNSSCPNKCLYCYWSKDADW